MAQSIVAWVDATLDNARMGPIHRRVLALITAGYFFDVIDFIILGSLVPRSARRRKGGRSTQSPRLPSEHAGYQLPPEQLRQALPA